MDVNQKKTLDDVSYKINVKDFVDNMMQWKYGAAFIFHSTSLAVLRKNHLHHLHLLKSTNKTFSYLNQSKLNQQRTFCIKRM